MVNQTSCHLLVYTQGEGGIQVIYLKACAMTTKLLSKVKTLRKPFFLSLHLNVLVCEKNIFQSQSILHIIYKD